MPRVGFEPTIPAFERAKTVHALERTATVIARPLLSLKRRPHLKTHKSLVTGNLSQCLTN
jgi:hypothetical protein